MFGREHDSKVLVFQCSRRDFQAHEFRLKLASAGPRFNVRPEDDRRQAGDVPDSQLRDAKSKTSSPPLQSTRPSVADEPEPRRIGDSRPIQRLSVRRFCKPRPVHVGCGRYCRCLARSCEVHYLRFSLCMLHVSASRYESPVFHKAYSEAAGIWSLSLRCLGTGFARLKLDLGAEFEVPKDRS